MGKGRFRKNNNVKKNRKLYLVFGEEDSNTLKMPIHATLTSTSNAMQSQGKYQREIWGAFGKHRGGECRTYEKKKKEILEQNINPDILKASVGKT